MIFSITTVIPTYEYCYLQALFYPTVLMDGGIVYIPNSWSQLLSRVRIGCPNRGFRPEREYIFMNRLSAWHQAAFVNWGDRVKRMDVSMRSCFLTAAALIVSGILLASNIHGIWNQTPLFNHDKCMKIVDYWMNLSWTGLKG